MPNALPRFRAPVHFNAENTLAVIPNLVEQTFGIQKPRSTEAWIGTCLIAQIAFSISSSTGIKPMVLSKHMLQHAGPGGGKSGYTLEQVLRTFELPVLTRTGPVWLKLGVTVHDSAQAAVDTILFGVPVLLIIGREVCDDIEFEAQMSGDGESYDTTIRPAENGTYHSFLVIGCEVKSELSRTNFFILRDSRHEYCHKGYLRLATKKIIEGWNFMRSLSIDVLELKR